MEGLRISQSKIYHFGIRIILSSRQLSNSKWRKVLHPPPFAQGQGLGTSSPREDITWLFFYTRKRRQLPLESALTEIFNKSYRNNPHPPLVSSIYLPSCNLLHPTSSKPFSSSTDFYHPLLIWYTSLWTWRPLWGFYFISVRPPHAYERNLLLLLISLFSIPFACPHSGPKRIEKKFFLPNISNWFFYEKDMQDPA